MSLSRTAASLAAAIVFAVCPAARAGGLRFQKPNVIPEPTSLRYSADVACRLDGASEVRVIAKDEASAEWVRGKLASFLHVAPRVVFGAGAALVMSCPAACETDYTGLRRNM